MADVARLAHLRAHIELPVLKRAAGLLEGYHRSIFKGHGQDFDDLSLYSPGDDVGDIDWKSSARAGRPIIRRFAQHSNLTVVLVADTGRNMGAMSSGGMPKNEVAMYLASIAAYVARDRGDRVALVAGDKGRVTQLPPRASTQDLEVMLTILDSMYSIDAPPSSLNIPLARALTFIKRRSLIIVITDEVRPSAEHETLLRRLRVKHEVLVLNVSDASPFVGARLEGNPRVADVDRSINLPKFMGKNSRVQREAGQHVRAQREETEAMLKRNGIVNVVVDSTADAIQRFALAVRRQQHLS
ncbi:DUF58 domain-containing protein [Populibacterium corticicola]|uniref:DUF58 domain-containing protein n=1 Tax=Populibacterium corticicola TaxID=1812826 RepID=A0ABW5XHN4_9MICO